MPDFLEISQVNSFDLRSILEEAKTIKAKRRSLLSRGALDRELPMQNHLAALIFEKPSTRTRMSFDVAVRQLGGQSILLSGADIHLGAGSETVSDTARVISRYADIAMIRTFKPESLKEFSTAADIPLINGLTDQSHPCQVMADILTFEEFRGPIEGRHVVWMGVGSNVCHSFIEAAAQFKFKLTFSGPDQFTPAASVLRYGGSNVSLESDPMMAVKDADLIVTDVWKSMHDAEDSDGALRDVLLPYQVNENLMAASQKDTLFMHCLPAHREEEVTSSVLDGKKSVVFDEAENRLHVQKAILKWCLRS